MKIVLHRDRWKVDDIINTLMFQTIEDYGESLCEELRLKQDKEILKILEKLHKYVDTESKSIKLFLNREFMLPNFPFDYDEFSFDKEVDDLPEHFRSIDLESEKFKVIKYIYKYKNGAHSKEKNDEEVDTDVKNIMSNNKMLIELLGSLDVSSELKWDLCNFMNAPECYYDEFADIIEKLIPHYKKAISKYEKKMNEFNDYLQKKIDNEGIEYFKETTDDYLCLDEYEEVHIATSFINPFSCSSYMLANKIYMQLGFEYENVLKQVRGKDELEVSLNILRTLCDPIKFRIIDAMKGKDLFGKEICEKVGLSKGTLSYHIDYLMSMNMIKFKKDGNKIYYSLNRESIEKAIDVLKDYLREE